MQQNRDWERLEYFRTAARHEHLGRAAQELGISVSALSRSVARLEADCGAALFDRVGRGLRLNVCGRALRARVERALFEIEVGKREVQELALGLASQVRLGFLSSFGGQVVPQLARAFRALQPRAEFRLLQGRLPVLREKLLSADIDLALVAPRFPDDEIAWAPIWKERFIAMLPPSHPLTHRKSIGIEELARDSFVALGPQYPTRQFLDRLAERANFVPRVVFEGDEMTTLVGMVGADIGVAVLPSAYAAGSGNAVPMPLRTPHCYRTVGLCWLKDRELSETTRMFRDHVIASSHSIAVADAARVVAAFQQRLDRRTLAPEG